MSSWFNIKNVAELFFGIHQMCISYPTSSNVMTQAIITSENSDGIAYRKDFMCITSK